MLRYTNGREDIAIVGLRFPQKPMGPWVSKSIGGFVDSCLIGQGSKCIVLPARGMLFTFGDLNDDFGIAKQGNTFTHVLSNRIGDARRGQERYFGTRVRQLCESIGQGIGSTFGKTQATYRGHGHSSYIDTWTFPLEHVNEVMEHHTMPRIPAQFRGITAMTRDHIPLMVFMFHTLVDTNTNSFRWDSDALVEAMNDLSCENTEVFVLQSSKTCNHKG